MVAGLGEAGDSEEVARGAEVGSAAQGLVAEGSEEAASAAMDSVAAVTAAESSVAGPAEGSARAKRRQTPLGLNFRSMEVSEAGWMTVLGLTHCRLAALLQSSSDAVCATAQQTSMVPG